MYAAVRLAVHQLSPKLHDVVMLRFWDGLRYSEIAARLGCSEEAAWKRFERARAFLIPLLEEDYMNYRQRGRGAPDADAFCDKEGHIHGLDHDGTYRGSCLIS